MPKINVQKNFLDVLIKSGTNYMYISNPTYKINYNQNYRNFNRNYVTFCHNNSAMLQQSNKLVNSYLKNFASQAGGFLQDGITSLQPSEIKMDTLRKIADCELQKMQNFPKDHILLIVTGRIGGGKTTYVKNNNLHNLFYIPDADEIKLLLPKYKECGASYVHRASCLINSANLSEALKRGINTVIQTSTTIDNIYDIIDEAKDYKYNDIILVHIDTSEENAIRRSQKRGELTGREISPEVIKERKYIDEIVPTFQTPLKGLSQLIVYNNDGDFLIKVKDVNFNIPQAVYTYLTDISE